MTDGNQTAVVDPNLTHSYHGNRGRTRKGTNVRHVAPRRVPATWHLHCRSSSSAARGTL